VGSGRVRCGQVRCDAVGFGRVGYGFLKGDCDVDLQGEN
jgi:hypothetical protein